MQGNNEGQMVLASWSRNCRSVMCSIVHCYFYPQSARCLSKEDLTVSPSQTRQRQITTGNGRQSFISFHYYRHPPMLSGRCGCSLEEGMSAVSTFCHSICFLFVLHLIHLFQMLMLLAFSPLSTTLSTFSFSPLVDYCSICSVNSYLLPITATTVLCSFFGALTGD